MSELDAWDEPDDEDLDAAAQAEAGAAEEALLRQADALPPDKQESTSARGDEGEAQEECKI